MEKTEIKNPNVRPGTFTDQKDWLFWFKFGGMGDYICWLPAIKYVAEKYQFVNGHLIVPHWFLPIAHNVLKNYKHWKIWPDEIPFQFQDGYPMKQASLWPVNATMTHLVDLGFIYFASLTQVDDEDRFYLELNLKSHKLPNELEDIDYVVLTPGATDPTRTMPAETLNEISRHLFDKGLTPVYLGASTMNKGVRKIHYEKEYDYSLGINLIDQTTPLQAAKIMEKARCVAGIDNGLLHLAAMTKTTIVFGYTIAGPMLRRPLRREGDLWELYAEKEKLPCIFCVEHHRFFNDHDFKDCIYKDPIPKCITALNAKTWCNTIDAALMKEK